MPAAPVAIGNACICRSGRESRSRNCSFDQTLNVMSEAKNCRPTLYTYQLPNSVDMRYFRTYSLSWAYVIDKQVLYQQPFGPRSQARYSNESAHVSRHMFTLPVDKQLQAEKRQWHKDQPGRRICIPCLRSVQRLQAGATVLHTGR